MSRSKLFEETAFILEIPVIEVVEYCMMGDEEALESVTPEELSLEMLNNGF